MAGSSRYIPLEDEDVDYENCDEEHPPGLPKYCSRDDETREKNKKTIQMPQQQIDIYLGYRGIPAFLQPFADSDTSMAALIREAHQSALGTQKMVREQLEANGNGCVTYEAEVTDNEQEEEEEEATAPGRGSSRGGGRRFRHQGVRKHACGRR